MPSNYFFTDPSSLDQNQTADKAFGPAPQNLNTQYRVCSLHTATNDPKAIAINDGTVAVQRITGSMPALVNIILKPTSQGSIDGFRIKYFIYRGIRADSLLGSASIVATSTQNDLTESIWNSQAAHNNRSGDTGEPPEDILGLQHQSLPDTDSVDKLFYDGSTNFCRPYVFAGWHIGTFDSTEFGIQVVIENYHSDFDLGKVRQLDHIITAPAYPSSGNSKDQFENKVIREAILSYIDPAAFYGLSYFQGVLATEGGAVTNYAESSIYENLLTDSANNVIRFNNYRTLYIDLRIDSGVSKSFFEQDCQYILDDFQFEGEVSSITKDFGLDFWPILIINDLDHPSAGALPQQTVTGLSFLYPTKTDVATRVLFLATGFKWQNIEKELIQHPLNESRIITSPEISNFSTSPPLTSINDAKWLIGIPYNGGLSAFYLKLQSFEESGLYASLNFTPENHLGSIFIVPPIEQSVSSGETYIEKTGHLQYIERPDDNFKAIYELGIAWEENRVIFFAMPISIKNSKTGYDIPIPFDESLYPYDSFYAIAEQWLKGIKLAKHKLSLNSGDIEILRYQEELFTDYWESSERDMLSISMTRVEYQGLITRISSNNYDSAIHPIFLTFSQVVGNDNNSVDYYNANLKFKGLIDDQISTIQIGKMSTGSDFYSIDQYIYSSDGATNEEGVSLSPISELYEIEVEGALTTALNNNGFGDIFNNLEQIEPFKEKVRGICRAAKTVKLKFGIADIFTKYGSQASGVTVPPGLYGVPNDTVVIELDQNYVNRTTEVSVISTIVHELMHGVVNFLLIDSRVYDPVATTTNYTKLAAVLPSLYEWYIIFGDEDRYIINPERNWEHNYMAAVQRYDIVTILKEYNNIDPFVISGSSVTYTDIFNGGALKTVSFSTEDFIQANSWGGLYRTRAWRQFGQKNHEKIQVYLCIDYIQDNKSRLSFYGPSSPTTISLYSTYSLSDF